MTDSAATPVKTGENPVKTGENPAKTASDAPRVRKRLTAEARKSSILAAARRAFTETGDMSGTTIKVIAEHSGISEGVIYRHFESKDQLFFEAVVEPLKEAVDDLVAAAAVMGMALILALESHHGKKSDRNRAVALISEGTLHGFFPPIEPARRG